MFVVCASFKKGGSMLIKHIYKGVAALLAVLLLSSCAITTAPTKATSESIGKTSEASSDLTSSTSPGDDDDDKKEEDVEVKEFVEANFSRLRSNMAVGDGEYLTTLAVLLDIDDANKDQFYVLTKNNFDQLFVSSDTTAEELVVKLRREVDLARI
ncbi:MAG: hypothetical protein DRR06_01230 [Gammaproteobacteria bacterium]|nr:MAG: hypothetical protein DRR06_01230 [Gammaproteobacteria bacterium]